MKQAAGTWTSLLLIAGLGLGAGCVGEIEGGSNSLPEEAYARDDKNDDNDERVTFLDQGWSDAQRALFYQTTQGSRMLPYAWFLHLEQAGGSVPFRSPDNMRQMGFLVDVATTANPDRLPIGFARDVDPVRGDAIGLTCAACHTGQLEYKKKRIRIDGGQALADLEQLQDGLLASLQATLADSGKFDRFAKKVIGAGASSAARAELRAEMEYMRDWWAARVERSRGLSPHGPGRTDAFTIIANEVLCDLLDVPGNCAPAFAPTQFPFLWDTPDFEWVQYNSSVHSSLGRNVGEVTGVYAEATILPTGGIISSANLDNLVALENTLAALESPAWPEDIFGAIDEDLRAQGETLYATYCAACHPVEADRTDPNVFGLTFAKVNFETPLQLPGVPPGPYGYLGTDPTAAVAFATRRAFVPEGWIRAVLDSRGALADDNTAPVAEVLNVAVGAIIQTFFSSNGITGADQLPYVGFRDSRRPTTAQLLTYKARPLNGAAFTAPYLHNGSVASMYELLLPPSERLTSFHVGNKEYDPVHLGYSTERNAHSVLLDTAQVGNGNGGHEYGTHLGHTQRMAVIEYIKTL